MMGELKEVSARKLNRLRDALGIRESCLCDDIIDKAIERLAQPAGDAVAWRVQTSRGVGYSFAQELIDSGMGFLPADQMPKPDAAGLYAPPVAAGDARDAALLATSKAFYNATIADPDVILRCPSPEKLAAVIAAGDALRAALTQEQPNG